ncbi:TPA: SGNH/GDSL hydrolase family protein [Klebsiella pneumoniae]|nr:SGNH/GDSL hydrolase family protein [Klebsiella pneumoniae]
MAELNPPLGTTTPEIFMDNVKRADELVNGPAGTVNDRGGEPLDTWRQMMAKNDEIRQNIIPLSKQYATLAAAQADIANIPKGSTTYYRSPDDSALAVEVMNVSGTLQPTGRKMPSQEAVSAIDEKINETNTRTEGLKTSEKSVYPLEVIDKSGKIPLYIDESGVVNAPAGIKTKSVSGIEEISVEILSTGDLVARSVTPQRLVDDSDNSYPFPIIDLNGRVLWYWDPETGRPICLGEPLTNHRGPLPGDIFAIGDSITAYGVAWSGANASGTSYAPCINDQSWHGWASLFTNGRIQLAGISATGGYTVSQVKNMHLPSAIAANSTFCVVMCGRNDIVQGIDIDTVTIPAFKSIFLQLRQAGIIPVVCTMSAQGNSGDNTRRIAEQKLNAWLRAYASAKILPLVDLHRYTVAPLTGDWIMGYNQDVSHPNGTGAKIMGQALVDGLMDWTSPVWPVRADEQLASGLTKNHITNALFLNNTGSNPSDWTITTSGTATISTDSAVKGNVWTTTNQASELTVSVTPGKKMQFGFFVKAGSQFSLYALAGGTGSTQNLAGLRGWKTAITDWSYFSYEFKVPSGITQATVKFSSGSVATSIAQISLIELMEI